MTKEERKQKKEQYGLLDIKGMIQDGVPFDKIEELTGWYPSQLSLFAKAWGLNRYGHRGTEARVGHE